TREHAAPRGGSAWPDPVPGGGGRRPQHGGVLREPEEDTVNGAPVVTARLVALTLLTAAVAGRPAAAQVGATTDIITGKLTRPDSPPLAAPVVIATSVETRVSQPRTSDANGLFTIVLPDRGEPYE